ncbi:DEA(D/H)-box RNA helicase family protein [Artemisia annua]|uniref:RNA helicase n=1 Tax=Artemisia annua TaxID=35608 RepID=A0A2U1MPZ6_ARTAN|nr:DEA(D/H)-box RNA helicase family protein [Artemisia annua]
MLGATCSIICTQPRRISAMSVSERIATKRGEKLGETVGYKVRLEVAAYESNSNSQSTTTNTRRQMGHVQGIANLDYLASNLKGLEAPNRSWLGNPRVDGDEA